MAPKIWIEPLGNAGNRALQYLAAEGVARLVPDAVVQNIKLPEWNMLRPHPAPEGRTVYTGLAGFRHDTQGLADCLKRGVMDTLAINGYCFHLDHYPPLAVCRELLGPMQGGEEAEGFGPDDLVCSLRGEEVLRAIHPRYLALPPGYYRKLAADCGLKLVFFGQIGDDPYAHSLRAAFPDARFISGRNPGYDFEMLRRSRNIALSLSTFTWLAAWLSDAARIYLPVGGIYNPLQQGNQGFLPTDDPRYRFVLLPLSEAVNVFHNPAGFLKMQDNIAAKCEFINAAQTAAIRDLAAKLREHGPFVSGFDPDFYAREQGLDGGTNPLEHYLRTGWRDKRRIRI